MTTPLYLNSSLPDLNEEHQEFFLSPNYDYSATHHVPKFGDLLHDHQVVDYTSKMRIMQKVIDRSETEHKALKYTLRFQDHQPDYNVSNNNKSSSQSVRVCSDCNTTSTPLWRSGPKSLCNASGIRQRKARRAMAVAGNGTAGLWKNRP